LFNSQNNAIETIEFNSANVMIAINKLKSNLSAGPDGLPPLLFKQLKHCIAEPLALIFTQLFSVAHVPSDWKKAIITPVFKKGAAGAVSNYRPISLTCVCSKIMERVISQQIYQYLTSNNVLHRSQHGFMRGRSTCTNLLESINDWTLYLEAKNTTTAVAYIDFSKAFDTVSHNKLFHKLYCYGIRGDLLSWLQQFFY